MNAYVASHLEGLMVFNLQKGCMLQPLEDITLVSIVGGCTVLLATGVNIEALKNKNRMLKGSS